MADWWINGMYMKVCKHVLYRHFPKKWSYCEGREENLIFRYTQYMTICMKNCLSFFMIQHLKACDPQKVKLQPQLCAGDYIRPEEVTYIGTNNSHTRCGRKVMRLPRLCTNRQSCCLPLHMAVRLTPAIDSVQVWTCYSFYVIVESVWSEVVFVRGITKMDRQKFEQRCAMKFCVKLGKSATVTYEKLQRAYGEHSLSRAQVFRWHQVLFRRLRTSGRQTSCRKTFNLKNGRQCGKSEVSCEVRLSTDVENDQ